MIAPAHGGRAALDSRPRRRRGHLRRGHRRLRSAVERLPRAARLRGQGAGRTHVRGRRADTVGADAGRGGRLPAARGGHQSRLRRERRRPALPLRRGTAAHHLLDIGLHTHDAMRANGATSPNASYDEPLAMLAGLSAVVAAPRDAITLDCSSPADVAGARRLVRTSAPTSGSTRRGRRRGAGGHRGADQRPAPRRAAGDAPHLPAGPTWVCHVQDGGHDALDPLIGLLPPAMPSDHGYGLWLARQLCSAVDVGTDGRARTCGCTPARLPPDPSGAGRDTVRFAGVIVVLALTAATTSCESLGGGLDVVNETDQALFIVERIPPDGGRRRYTINDCSDSDLEVNDQGRHRVRRAHREVVPRSDVDDPRGGRVHPRGRLMRASSLTG